MSSLNALKRWKTWHEIHAQADIWRQWGGTFNPLPIRQWIADLSVDEVWLCGAGTSAYIGDIIVSGLEGLPGPVLRSVPTTDFITQPQKFLRGKRPLVVNFGRSGNSTESIAMLDALDTLVPEIPQLHITCNRQGVLATRTRALSKCILLPPATHDAGFAMTSSFSTMLLTALALFDEPCDFKKRMAMLADQLSKLLPEFITSVGGVCERVVYLGTGSQACAAREAALKVLELSAGRIVSLSDSVMGFRHGPKSFVNEDTTIIVFLSAQERAHNYEKDLLVELRDQFPKVEIITIGSGGDINIDMPFGDTWAAPLCVVSSQVAAVIWGEQLGLNVDNPFLGLGTLTRVVEGIKTYPVTL